jgi:hypothetical protein
MAQGIKGASPLTHSWTGSGALCEFFRLEAALRSEATTASLNSPSMGSVDAVLSFQGQCIIITFICLLYGHPTLFIGGRAPFHVLHIPRGAPRAHLFRVAMVAKRLLIEGGPVSLLDMVRSRAA